MSDQNDDLNGANNPDDPNNPSTPGQSGDPDDFANFDPARYLEKRGIKTGRYSNDAGVEREAAAVERKYSGGRGGRRGRQDEEFNPADVPVGLFGNIGRIMSRGEGISMYAEILGELMPLLGRFLPIIGCLLVVICVVVCGGGYLLIHSLTTH